MFVTDPVMQDLNTYLASIENNHDQGCDCIDCADIDLDCPACVNAFENGVILCDKCYRKKSIESQENLPLSL